MDIDLQTIKRNNGIIGNSQGLNRALDVAVQVAATDLSVLILGESGAGKEKFPQIIHRYSRRSSKTYIAVNCGAIPEGTIDSELFGHVKGAFTNAVSDRKGYFEEANGGTIFLDEVAELPLATQARLLRVLESGEFMKVGSSKVEKTDVRIVAATNVNLIEKIKNGKFREDLYYRLNTVPIVLPPLRERKEDIELLFRKFARDFADNYTMQAVKLTPEAVDMLVHYHWPGNIRQLKNITEQVSIMEKSREITPEILGKYLVDIQTSALPALINNDSGDFSSEREFLYKVIFEMKKEMNDLRTMLNSVISQSPNVSYNLHNDSPVISEPNTINIHDDKYYEQPIYHHVSSDNQHAEVAEEVMSLAEQEKELIEKVLEKHGNKRRPAAKELGISERTLYRKITEYGLEK